MDKQAVFRKNTILAQINSLFELGLNPHIVTFTDHAEFAGPTHLDQDGFTVFQLGGNSIRKYSVEEEGISFSTTFTGQGYTVFIPYNAIAGIITPDDKEIGFLWDVIVPEESVVPEPTPVDASVNNGAPIGKKGWKPTLVK